MTELSWTVTDEELNEYVDGVLDSQRSAEIAAIVAADPDLSMKVSAYAAQKKGLHALFDGILREPIPPRLLQPLIHTAAVNRGSNWNARVLLQMAACFVVALAGGGVFGWWLHSQQSVPRDILEPFVHQAILAHQLLEADAPQETTLTPNDADVLTIQSAQLPFKAPYRAPTLREANYVPIALRSISGGPGPAMQVAYRDEEGGYVTMYVRQHSGDGAVPFRSAAESNYQALFWLDGPLVYVLVGEKPQEDLLSIARAVYVSRAVTGIPATPTPAAVGTATPAAVPAPVAPTPVPPAPAVVP